MKRPSMIHHLIRGFAALILIAVSTGCGYLEIPYLREPTPEPTGTPIPTAPLPTRNPATLVPTITPTRCIDSFYFVQDITIPDYTVIQAGAKFTKKWEIRNNSSCNWNPNYKLRFISGEDFNSPSTLSFPNAKISESVILSLELTAPSEPGTYEGQWKIFADNDESFGTILTVTIIVYY